MSHSKAVLDSIAQALRGALPTHLHGPVDTLIEGILRAGTPTGDGTLHLEGTQDTLLVLQALEGRKVQAADALA